jgi:hypothetical protein
VESNQFDNETELSTNQNSQVKIKISGEQNDHHEIEKKPEEEKHPTI